MLKMPRSREYVCLSFMQNHGPVLVFLRVELMELISACAKGGWLVCVFVCTRRSLEYDGHTKDALHGDGTGVKVGEFLK